MSPDSESVEEPTPVTATAERPMTESVPDKGLKAGALGLVSSVVIGVASTAPA